MKRFLVVAVVFAFGLLVAAPPASAHPLGNFSVNRYAALTLGPASASAVVVADIAELPTLQDPAPTCLEAAAAFTVTAGGRRLRWTTADSSVVRSPGAGGLATTRLSCRLSAPVTLTSATPISVANAFRDDRIGWRELVATAGPGVRLSGSSLPVVSASDELRRYPDDLLSSPPDVRAASFTAGPGAGAASAASAGGISSGSSPFGTSGPLAGAERWLENTVGGREITPWIGLLAVLLALLLGAGHAALPGHGKTVMAAYMAGRRGRPRDAVAVGATVTVTHTGGVLALGLLLTTVAGIAGESVLGYLGLTSGVLVTAIGVSALISARRRRGPLDHHHHHGHSHSHIAPHSHTDAGSHEHAHIAAHPHAHVRNAAREGSLVGAAVTPGGLIVQPPSTADDRHHHSGHNHGHATAREKTLVRIGAVPLPGVDEGHRHHEHSHAHGASTGTHGRAHQDGGRLSRWSIAGLGIAGGLVPSPSALIVLLGAAALGRTVFGVLLVLAYGLGMAATLTAAGLLLIKVRDRLEGRFPQLPRLQAALPTVTATLIVLVGAGLAGRALLTLI